MTYHFCFMNMAAIQSFFFRNNTAIITTHCFSYHGHVLICQFDMIIVFLFTKEIFLKRRNLNTLKGY